MISFMAFSYNLLQIRDLCKFSRRQHLVEFMITFFHLTKTTVFLSLFLSNSNENQLATNLNAGNKEKPATTLHTIQTFTTNFCVINWWDRTDCSTTFKDNNSVHQGSFPPMWIYDEWYDTRSIPRRKDDMGSRQPITFGSPHKYVQAGPAGCHDKCFDQTYRHLITHGNKIICKPERKGNKTNIQWTNEPDLITIIWSWRLLLVLLIGQL